MELAWLGGELADHGAHSMMLTPAGKCFVKCGAFGPVFISSTVALLRHFATVFGLIPSSRLNAAGEACDHCIAARMACAVVARP